ncbi:hypothetical protein GGF37_006750 [Kickxella alabastrina]|nr:hypothetical protein GGF37_006750 [Kickxella alabastrina]
MVDDTPSSHTASSSCGQGSQSPNINISARDSNLVDILFSSALDGEFVRDQISGTYQQPSVNPDPNTEPNLLSERKKAYSIDPTLITRLQTLESQAIRTAESGDISQAIAQLTQIITDCPHYASAYNNRAQAHRIQGQDDQALEDLDLAISYAQDEKTLAQAFTQKAIVMRGRGDQDAAFYNFSMGAKYGNEVAKMAAPKENPYAKLCGKIVSEAMRQLLVPGQQQDD